MPYRIVPHNVEVGDVHKIISFSGVFACLPRRSRRRQGLSFLDRINGIYWIIFFFSPFPEEKEKENPPVCELWGSGLESCILFLNPG
jgi:hypothetical protein